MTFHHHHGQVFLRQARIDEETQVGLLATFGTELRQAIRAGDQPAAAHAARLGGELLRERHRARLYRRSREVRS